MNNARAKSSPELFPFSASEDSTPEGVATNVKLLLKLIQDHKDASSKDGETQRLQRVAGMISIINDIKKRIERLQNSGQRIKQEAGLRRSSSDARRINASKEKNPQEENERLRREVASSAAARKTLERMFTGLGKEKKIMAAELARKAQEMKDMEEHLNDIKAQNEKLLAKVQACVVQHKEKRTGGGGTVDVQGKAALQERNRTLSEQLLKPLDGYRTLKRKFKDVREENTLIRKKIGQLAEQLTVGLNQIQDLRQQVAGRSGNDVDIDEELSALDNMFRSFEAQLMITSQLWSHKS